MRRVRKIARAAGKKAARKTDTKNAGTIRVQNPKVGGRPGTMDKEDWFLAAKERLSDLPDVRPEKIREAEKRIEEGFYDRPEVVSKIVDRFLEEMGIS